MTDVAWDQPNNVQDARTRRSQFDEHRRRTFTTTKMLNMGSDLVRDEARRLRDLLAYYVVPLARMEQRMPAEEDIARQFRASRNSARAAMKLLADDQAVRRIPGVGTYAGEAPTLWRSDRLRDVHTAEVETVSTLLGWNVEYDIPDVMRQTFPDGATRVAVFEKRRTYRGVPGLLRTFFVPLREQDSLGPEDAEFDLLGILEDRFGHQPLRAERIINAIVADESSATQLEVQVGHPLLYIQTAVYGPDGALVLLYFVRQRGEVVQLSVEPERFVGP